VTGANTGIGFHVTRHLARKKAHVIMACRSEERGKAALADIKKEFPNSNVELRLLDVASKHSVSAFVESFLKDFDRLDVLVNNAGVMQAKTFLSDGVENTLMTNCGGPFLLTGLLLPILKKTQGSRVVTVTSGGHRDGKLEDLAKLNDVKLDAFGWKYKRYALSKAINVAFHIKLAEDFAANQYPTISVGCHPGLSNTDLTSHVDSTAMKVVYDYFVMPLLAQNAEMGAAPLLFAATDTSVKNGSFYGPCGIANLNGFPAENDTMGKANEKDFREKVWGWSEDWAGIKYKY